MNNLVIVNPESGDEVSIPVTEFVGHGFLDVITNDRHKEINLVTVIRTIQEKAKSRYKKQSVIQLRVHDKQVDIEIPYLAKTALFSYSSEEISDLFDDPMLSDYMENAVTRSLPNDAQPSSSAQRTLAMRIAEVLDIDLGYEIIASKEKIGSFISQNQFELDAYERDIEGYEVVSKRMSDALVLFLEKNEAWEGAFNIAFELYLQLAQRGRELVIKSVDHEIADQFWNDESNRPEGQVCSIAIYELGLRHNRTASFSSQFEALRQKEAQT